MDTAKAITHIGLCAGYGGIELGLGRVLPTLRSVALCEIEAFPIANLVSKMEAGLMDAAPVWTDLKSFPWESFRDRVDILTGGYPCQPFSAAGKRAGKDDPRHLWPWIADGIRILRPRICFFENVEGHISLGLSSVISDLEELGYKVSWGIFSAREVGAPHQRKRVFILAYSISSGMCGGRSGCESGDKQQRVFCAEGERHEIRGETAGCGSELALTSSIGSAAGIPRPQQGHEGVAGVFDNGCHQAWPSRPGQPQHGWEPPRVVGNTTQLFSDGSHNHSRVGERSEEISQSGDSSWKAMGNTDPRRLASGINAGSSAEADRGGQGDIEQAESGQAQPTLGRDANGTTDWMDYAELYTTCDNRTDELRLLGNGVVPATAERAFRTLLKDLI